MFVSMMFKDMHTHTLQNICKMFVTFIPAVIRKYVNRANENTTIADGWTSHDGFRIFKFGTANTEKGNLNNISILTQYFYYSKMYPTFDLTSYKTTRHFKN